METCKARHFTNFKSSKAGGKSTAAGWAFATHVADPGSIPVFHLFPWALTGVISVA